MFQIPVLPQRLRRAPFCQSGWMTISHPSSWVHNGGTHPVRQSFARPSGEKDNRRMCPSASSPAERPAAHQAPPMCGGCRLALGRSSLASRRGQDKRVVYHMLSQFAMIYYGKLRLFCDDPDPVWKLSGSGIFLLAGRAGVFGHGAGKGGMRN